MNLTKPNTTYSIIFHDLIYEADSWSMLICMLKVIPQLSLDT